MEAPLALIGAMYLLGLATGVHCLGMCGGIVAAFGTRPVAVLRDARAGFEWPRQLAFNAGRIASYTLAGAAAGFAGSLGGWAGGVAAAQVVLFAAANLMLVLIGLQLAGASAPLSRLEALGAPLWRRIAPHAGRFASVHTLPRAFVAGSLWGWLPCGFVYGALTTSMLAGSAAAGASAMAAFGLGTLPYLLAAGVGAARLRALLSRARWRIGVGMLILGAGVFGLSRAATVADARWIGFVCI